MSSHDLNTPRGRLSEFVRQARLLRDADPEGVFTVWTDTEAERIALSINDLQAVLDEGSSLAAAPGGGLRLPRSPGRHPGEVLCARHLPEQREGS